MFGKKQGNLSIVLLVFLLFFGLGFGSYLMYKRQAEAKEQMRKAQAALLELKTADSWREKAKNPSEPYAKIKYLQSAEGIYQKVVKSSTPPDPTALQKLRETRSELIAGYLEFEMVEKAQMMLNQMKAEDLSEEKRAFFTEQIEKIKETKMKENSEKK